VSAADRLKALSTIKREVERKHLKDADALDEACQRVGFWYWYTRRKKQAPEQVFCLCVQNAHLIESLKEDEYVQLDKKRVKVKERGTCTIDGEEWAKWYVGKFVLGLDKPPPPPKESAETGKEKGVKERVRKPRNARGDRWKAKRVEDSDDEEVQRRPRGRNRGGTERKRNERSSGWKRKHVDSGDEEGVRAQRGPERKRKSRRKNGSSAPGAEWKAKHVNSSSEDEEVPLQRKAGRKRKGKAQDVQWKAKHVNSSSEEEEVPLLRKSGRKASNGKATIRNVQWKSKHVSSDSEMDWADEKVVQSKSTVLGDGNQGKGFEATRAVGPGIGKQVRDSRERCAKNGKKVKVTAKRVKKAESGRGMRERQPLVTRPIRKAAAKNESDAASEPLEEDLSSGDEVLALGGRNLSKKRAVEESERTGDELVTAGLGFENVGLDKATLEAPFRSSLVGPEKAKIVEPLERGSTGGLSAGEDDWDALEKIVGGTGSEISALVDKGGAEKRVGASPPVEKPGNGFEGTAAKERPADSPDWVALFTVDPDEQAGLSKQTIAQVGDLPPGPALPGSKLSEKDAQKCEEGGKYGNVGCRKVSGGSKEGAVLGEEEKEHVGAFGKEQTGTGLHERMGGLSRKAEQRGEEVDKERDVGGQENSVAIGEGAVLGAKGEHDVGDRNHEQTGTGFDEKSGSLSEKPEQRDEERGKKCEGPGRRGDLGADEEGDVSVSSREKVEVGGPSDKQTVIGLQEKSGSNKVPVPAPKGDHPVENQAPIDKLEKTREEERAWSFKDKPACGAALHEAGSNRRDEPSGTGSGSEEREQKVAQRLDQGGKGLESEGSDGTLEKDADLHGRRTEAVDCEADDNPGTGGEGWGKKDSAEQEGGEGIGGKGIQGEVMKGLLQTEQREKKGDVGNTDNSDGQIQRNGGVEAANKKADPKVEAMQMLKGAPPEKVEEKICRRKCESNVEAANLLMSPDATEASAVRSDGQLA
jgi:hypothetical protein